MWACTITVAVDVTRQSQCAVTLVEYSICISSLTATHKAPAPDQRRKYQGSQQGLETGLRSNQPKHGPRQ